MERKNGIVKAGRDDAALLGDILGDAFMHDPALNWVIPHTALYPAFFTMLSRQIYLRHSHCYLDARNRGAALWLPPGIDADIPMSPTQLGLILRLVTRRGPGVIKRLSQAQATLTKFHPETPHYYLHAIGARRRFQGLGVGSALLKAGTRVCDEAGMPAYLESSSLRNAELYMRHGFEVFAEAPVGEGGPPLRFMWREPRSARGEPCSPGN